MVYESENSYDEYSGTNETTDTQKMERKSSYFKHYTDNCDYVQKHTHEFLGSTKLAEIEDDPHNHRGAGVTGEAIKYGKTHFHKIETNTDFFDHFHMIIVSTGPAIPVGNGKHVHFVMGETTEVDGHVHELAFATLIDSPLV
jgi:hypothetical protein